MTRARVPLSEYVTEYSVRNKADEDIPVYSVTNSQGFCTEYFGKEVASKDKTTYKIVPRGYFAYNPSRINVGSIDWQRHEDRVIVSPLYNVFAVSDKLDKQYLYYFLRSDIGRQMIQAKAAGSVRDNLKIEMLKEMTVPDMTVDEQRRCAAVLDRLHGLIVLRQQQLASLDTLIKARFVEMFGEPVTNDKKLPTLMGQDFFKLSNGKFITESKRFDVGIPAYGGNGISWYTDDVLCQNDTIVVGRVGFQSGNVHLAYGPMWITDNAMFISSYKKKEYDLVFLYYLMDMVDFSRFQDAGDLKKITQKPFMSFEYIHPELTQQQAFAAFVAQIDKSKAVVQAAHVIARNLHSRRKQKCRILNF